ncbi:MAG: serine protease, partial [Chloroflexota bacterium]
MPLRSRPQHWTLLTVALAAAVILSLAATAILSPLSYAPAQAQDAEPTEEPTPTPPPPPLVELNEDVIKRATVYLMQTYNNQNQPIISCVGSGTLISADGLILTNAHTALSSDTCRSDRVVIAVTVRTNEPPVPTYTAEVVESSAGLDLAVLRINGYLDGRPIEPGALSLPFVELGDSAAVALDDTITVVGYPDLGNSPVEVTRGTITGFTAEARAGDRAWVRTGAVIPGTMTGGGAYNREGKLIGIPTIAPGQVAGQAVDCRVLQDTNLDGRANQADACVPVGGFISALRPARVARGLARAAALGIRQGPDLTSTVLAPPEGEPSFSRLFFATRVNEAGVPANVVGSAPAGITSLYLFFDYQNMVNGMIYELRVTVDDVTEAIYSLPPSTWSGGRSGTWYIGSSN